MNISSVISELLSGFLELDPLWRILICAGCALIAIVILVLIIVRARKSDKRALKASAQPYVPAQPDSVQSAQTPVTASLTTGDPAEAEINEQGIYIRLVPEAPLEAKKTEYTLFDELTIGRDAKCDIVLEDLGVSSQHARVFYQNGAVYIEDCGSTNGTAVEGMRIYTANRLTSGDFITAGSVSFRLRF